MPGNIRRATYFILMTRNENTVLGHYEVRLDEIDPILHRDEVGSQGVLGYVAASTTVTDDHRPPLRLTLEGIFGHGSC
jgi:hypothetical protein